MLDWIPITRVAPILLAYNLLFFFFLQRRIVSLYLLSYLSTTCFQLFDYNPTSLLEMAIIMQIARSHCDSSDGSKFHVLPSNLKEKKAEREF